jgi:osmotically-inducible protein OsmY
MSVREAALTSAIISRLASDKRVGDLPISPFVIDGDVYLIGHVKTLEQRDTIEFIVKGTPGVRRVNTDEIDVGELA